jgi:hypothetical protein
MIAWLIRLISSHQRARSACGMVRISSALQ